MAKAVISNKIYLDKPDEGFESIEKALTYKIAPTDGNSTMVIRGKRISKIETVKNFTRVTTKVLSIPQGRFDLIPEYYEVLDRRVYNEVPFPNPKFELNEDQLPIYNSVEDSCFINAAPGWGKTFTALHIARKLAQKTLIITHTVALRDQWAGEIEKMFGHPPGLIGSGTFDVEDHFIVVSNIQTLVKVADNYAKEFGLVIVDEAHHLPATTFTSTLDKFHARYRIGLSGTMTRKDGKHVLYTDSFGPTVYKPPKSNTIDPVVRILKTGKQLTHGVPWVNKMNDLLYDEDYQQFIANIAKAQIAKGHRVLITADRVEFLEKVSEFIGKDTCVLITGSTETKSQEVRERLLKEVSDGHKMCVAASRQIFTEGLSLNILSCVILAVPSGNKTILEQLIGRIMRKHKIKEMLPPEVIDLQFAGYDSKKHNNDRIAFYLEMGWEILSV